jgi:hypothetical protein
MGVESVDLLRTLHKAVAATLNKYAADNRELRAENARLRELLHEVASAGSLIVYGDLEFVEDANYVDIQIDRELWDELQKHRKEHQEEAPDA